MTPTTRQRGQVMPLVLAGIVLAAVVFILVTNAGNKVTEKSVVVNAADAAAYSGGVWVARHFNFLAYTNRAKIANHVGVGHFIAYVSWIRYVEEVVERADIILQFIPIANIVSEVLVELANAFRELAELEAEFFVPGVDLLNRFYDLAQAEAHLALATSNLEDLMQETASRFDPDIRINDSGAIATLDPSIAGPIETALSVQNIVVPLFSRPTFADKDDEGDEIVRLIEKTYGGAGPVNQAVVDSYLGPVSDFVQSSGGQIPNLPGVALLNGAFESTNGNMSRKWLTDRTNPFRDFLSSLPTLAFDISLDKNFVTEHTLDNWEAEDSLDFKVEERFTGKDIIDVTVGSGEADAQEFFEQYQGVPVYSHLTNPLPANHVLPIVAYASKSQTDITTREFFDLNSENIPVSGLAIAQVEHRRPSIGFPVIKAFDREVGEYANQYNPFWEARLAGVSSDSLATSVFGVLLGRFLL